MLHCLLPCSRYVATAAIGVITTVCVLRKKLMFPPIYTQHKQSVSVPMPPRENELVCRHKLRDRQRHAYIPWYEIRTSIHCKYSEEIWPLLSSFMFYCQLKRARSKKFSSTLAAERVAGCTMYRIFWVFISQEANTSNINIQR